MRGNSSVVERHLAKVDVAGPTPVSRSNNEAIRNLTESPFFLPCKAIYCLISVLFACVLTLKDNRPAFVGVALFRF